MATRLPSAGPPLGRRRCALVPGRHSRPFDEQPHAQRRARSECGDDPWGGGAADAADRGGDQQRRIADVNGAELFPDDQDQQRQHGSEPDVGQPDGDRQRANQSILHSYRAPSMTALAAGTRLAAADRDLPTATQTVPSNAIRTTARGSSGGGGRTGPRWAPTCVTPSPKLDSVAADHKSAGARTEPLCHGGWIPQTDVSDFAGTSALRAGADSGRENHRGPPRTGCHA